MSDISADVFAEGGGLDQRMLSHCRFLFLSLSEDNKDRRLLMLAGIFFIVLGGWLLSWWTYFGVVFGFV